jgi:syntaxin-binding protein 1
MASRRTPATSSTISGPTQSLRDIVQQSLGNVLQNSTAQLPADKWIVLVVDPQSLRVISSSIGMYNLMEHHVSIVEDLMKKRAPFRDQAVLYLVEPNEESVSRIIEDWTPNKTTLKQGPLYGNTIFLYFLGRLPDALFAKIKACKELVKRVKILQEVNLDFLTKEAQGFHFDMTSPSIYADLYMSKYQSANNISPLQERMVQKLVTVCATLNEYPHVRYPANNELCKNLAFVFQQKMNEFVGSNSSWWYNGDGLHLTSDRATLLLLDRRDDCLSPLMHEFTYEAMVNDLLPIDDDRITYNSINAGTAKEGTSEEGTTKMDALLNDNDDVWVELRGKHIADVIQMLSAKIRDIVGSNTGSALNNSAKGNGKALSINQMAKALKALPEYREIMSKLSQHMQIAHQCMDVFNKKRLLELSDLEQTFATGKTDEGRTPRLKELLGQVVEEFRKQPDSLMRLRLLAIVIVSQRGLESQSYFDKLLAEANLSPKELKALKNLEKMGCPLVQAPETGAKGKMAKLGAKKVMAYGAGAVENDSEYASSRYVCLLKAVMEKAAQGNLSVDEYPSVLPLPDAEAMLAPTSKSTAKSVRKMTASSKWAGSSASSSTQGAKKKGHGGRQIIFMAGGMCYSELRSAREVMASSGMDIVVGSNRFIKPIDFMGDLKNLSRGES